MPHTKTPAAPNWKRLNTTLPVCMCVCARHKISCNDRHSSFRFSVCRTAFYLNSISTNGSYWTNGGNATRSHRHVHAQTHTHTHSGSCRKSQTCILPYQTLNSTEMLKLNTHSLFDHIHALISLGIKTPYRLGEWHCIWLLYSALAGKTSFLIHVGDTPEIHPPLPCGCFGWVSKILLIHLANLR